MPRGFQSFRSLLVSITEIVATVLIIRLHPQRLVVAQTVSKHLLNSTNQPSLIVAPNISDHMICLTILSFYTFNISKFICKVL